MAAMGYPPQPMKHTQVIQFAAGLEEVLDTRLFGAMSAATSLLKKPFTKAILKDAAKTALPVAAVGAGVGAVGGGISGALSSDPNDSFLKGAGRGALGGAAAGAAIGGLAGGGVTAAAPALSRGLAKGVAKVPVGSPAFYEARQAGRGWNAALKKRGYAGPVGDFGTATGDVLRKKAPGFGFSLRQRVLTLEAKLA